MANKITVSMPRMSLETEAAVIMKRFAEIVLKNLRVDLKGKTLKIRARRTVLDYHVLGQTTFNNEIIMNWNAEPSDLLLSLAHELVHIEQMCTGQFAKWLETSSFDVPYRERPWEIDAYKRQKNVMTTALKMMIAENPRLKKGWGCDSGPFSDIFAMRVYWT